MARYLLKRLLYFLPTLLVVSLVAFGLSRLAPGDPVEQLLRSNTGGVGGALIDARRVYRETAALLGLDKPPFYFSISSRAYPDTLYRIADKDHRTTLRQLLAQYGNWEYIEPYYRQLQGLELTLQLLPDSIGAEALTSMRSLQPLLYLTDRPEVIKAYLGQLDSLANSSPALMAGAGPPVAGLAGAFSAVVKHPRRYRLYIPDLKWYGFDNQYHHWFVGCIRGDFGISYIDGRPVGNKLSDAIRWTLLINGLAILLAFLLSIPLGVYSAVYHGKRFDRMTTILLFMLYSLPTFWTATLLVVFFTNAQYGMEFFPPLGVGTTDPSVPFWTRLGDRVHHLVLPVFCLTYGSLAYITRQMRGSMVDALQQDYVRTAIAKGLSRRQVIWKHAFRNALFPIITLFGSVFPAVLAGSVVIEVIFAIPGMGKLTIEAIYQRDWPVVYAIFILSAVLTMIGILVADIGYALADPRVSYKKK